MAHDPYSSYAQFRDMVINQANKILMNRKRSSINNVQDNIGSDGNISNDGDYEAMSKEELVAAIQQMGNRKGSPGHSPGFGTSAAKAWRCGRP